MTTTPPEPDVFAGSAAYARRRRDGSDAERPVLTIGNFDGVHLGHHSLLHEVVAAARQRGVPACVYTFDPPPRAVLAPSQAQPRITAWPDRVRLLGELGIDHVIVERFTRAFAQHPPEWFVDEVLGRRIDPVEIIVGYDFRFGRARAGTVDTVAKRLDVPIRAVSALSRGEVVVSSSAIRRRVLAGDVAAAADFLGRPHLVRGVVVAGDRRGRAMGYPTANVDCGSELLPAAGVYAVRVRVDGGPWLQGIANLGVRPTFGPDGPLKVEVHLFDFKANIYGCELEVGFVGHIRGEQRFDGLDPLVQQIRTDVKQARALLADAS